MAKALTDKQAHCSATMVKREDGVWWCPACGLVSEELTDRPRKSCKTFSAGVVGLSVNVKLDAGEVKTWSPERITALFDGIAKVQAAISGKAGTIQGPGATE